MDANEAYLKFLKYFLICGTIAACAGFAADAYRATHQPCPQVAAP
jgi:hypothetical protein